MNGSSSRWILPSLIFYLLFNYSGTLHAQDERRWQMNDDGSITWTIGQLLPHDDHVEMSGKQISCVLRYGVGADSSFHATRSLVWPMLRTIPNNTHASLTRRFAEDGFSYVLLNGKPITGEKVSSITLNGTLVVNSKTTNGFELTREFFPSTDQPVYGEIYSIKNLSGKEAVIEIPGIHLEYNTDPVKGTEGSYYINVDQNSTYVLNVPSGSAFRFPIIYTGRKGQQQKPVFRLEEEKEKRLAFIRQVWSDLVLETPDTVLNRAFAFAKIRASESIFATKGGPMHGPGGEAYYAAIWANDQAEYAGPFFPYLGYDYGNKASLNAYLHFARFMNPEYKPIPSSIIAEGTDIWNGAGDRGDGAMIAYGAARYALTSGDKQQAEQLWPLIEWCLEYCHRKLNTEGVVISDADELEGRFPAGSANLCTSSLYYDALNSAVYLGRSLGRPKTQLMQYQTQAAKLKLAIEKYFGSNIGGFNTYKYYKENDTLRAWICIPLTMGIFTRSQATIDALFSPKLWTKDGLASVAGDRTFWDRSTLYALRGVLAAGGTEQALTFLHYYSNRRLLGEHVPYPVEAYPEGNQRHLSAESALYCRIYTEGLFGIRPTGLHSFQFTPRLPQQWPSMRMQHIRAFGADLDITVEREGTNLKVTVTDAGRTIFSKVVHNGEDVVIGLSGASVK